MFRVILTLTFVFALLNAQAQQERQYTQFMFNQLSFNPAYAGTQASPTFLALYRNQWMGLEGSPESALLQYHQSLLNERVGIGGTLSRTSVGINRNITADIAYSYRMHTQVGVFSAGLQASMRNIRQNWADGRLSAAQGIATDAAIPMEPGNRTVANFGAGLYFQGEQLFGGIAVPRLVHNNIETADLGGEISREVRHFYTMVGYAFTPSETVKITPQALLKIVQNSPIDADINVMALWNKKFTTGITYRTGSGKTARGGESLDLLAGFQATDHLFFALSYDIPFTKLRNYNNGSIEAVARYVLRPVEEDVEYVSPRE